MAGGPVQEDTGSPGGPVQNISVGGGGGRGGALAALGLIGVFKTPLCTRDYLPVNNSLLHKTQILFLWR
jgi:hypothetical protein